MSVYTTISGDTWDKISYKIYGSGAYTDKLIKLNSDYIDTMIFSAGITLATPDKEDKTSENMPPWKR